MKNSTVHVNMFLRSRISAAFRTGWACLLAALLVELGNLHVQWMAFPIFSYIMAVTIVGESTFGKVLQDATHAILGIIQGAGMAMINLQFVHPERMSLWVAILCISVSTFIITYPKSTDLMTKRVAMAETAIIYINAHIQRGMMNDVLFPLHVGATATVGAACAAIALLLPLPRFAYSEVHSQARLAARITCERLRVMVDAFCAKDPTKASSLNLQAKSLAKIGSTALAEVNAKEGDIQWEIPGCLGYAPNVKRLAKGLNGLRKHLMGMELALQTDLNSYSRRCLQNVLKNCLIYLTDWTSLALRHASTLTARSMVKQNHRQIVIEEGNQALVALDEMLIDARQRIAYKTSSTEMDAGMTSVFQYILAAGALTIDTKAVGDFESAFQTQSAAFFFLFVLKKFVAETQNMISDSKPTRRYPNSMKQTELKITVSGMSQLEKHSNFNHPPHSQKACCRCSSLVQEQQSVAEVQQTSWIVSSCKFFKSFKPDFEQFRTAIKMSACMALATFLGSWFNESHGYWADITVALGFGNAMGGSFKIANLRAQGTVAGSMYGLVAATLTANYPYLRFVALVPWVIFTAFLRRSKIFEYTGALSAFTGAIVILGRRHKETDAEFTIVRLVEAFMGMASFILVELIILPKRASYEAREELITGIRYLRDLVANVLSSQGSRSQCLSCCCRSLEDLKAKEKTVRISISRQRALVKEAMQEPEFWFAPFPGNIYTDLVDIQGRMCDLLQFTLYSMEEILRISLEEQLPIEKLREPLESSFKIVEEKVVPSIGFLEKILGIKSFDDQVQPSKQNTQKVCDKADEENQGAKLRINESGTAGQPEKHLDRCMVDVMDESKEGVHAGNLQSVWTETVPNRNKTFMDAFEKGFQVVFMDLMQLSTEMGKPDIQTYVCNTIILALNTLAFSMQGLLKEISELEKAVHELLQGENPWSLIDFWEASNSMGQMWPK